jgi:hypothetical protein
LLVSAGVYVAVITEVPAFPTTIDPEVIVATEDVAELYAQVPPVGLAEGFVTVKEESPYVLVTFGSVPTSGSAFATVTVAAVNVATAETTPEVESVSVMAHVYEPASLNVRFAAE